MGTGTIRDLKPSCLGRASYVYSILLLSILLRWNTTYGHGLYTWNFFVQAFECDCSGVFQRLSKSDSVESFRGWLCSMPGRKQVHFCRMGGEAEA